MLNDELQARNRQLEADDKAHIWHPFTQMQDWLQEKPLIVEKGQGNQIIDIEGKHYIDGISSLWTNVHGHRQPKLDQALRDQIDRIAHATMLGLSNVPAIQCARKLADISPGGLNRVFYSDNGSTAVEVALKMAYQYHQQAERGNPGKKKFISLTNAYHGDTIGSVSVGGIDLFHKVYGPLLFDTIKVTAPYCYRCPFGCSHPGCDLSCLDHLEKKMGEHAHEACALVIEPLVQGAAGMLTQPPGYLKRVRELCTRYDILMIADEVAVGFGKTGKMFACEHEEVVPDLMALAKGISGGYLPLAATLASEEIYQGFLGQYEAFKSFFHGHTYTGNPLACAVAVANLELFEEENVLGRLQPIIARLQAGLDTMRDLPHVGDIRNRGVMTGIELVRDKDTKAPYDPAEKIGHRVILEARKNGLIIRPLGNVIIFMPPLSITHEEIDAMIEITTNAIKTITE
ncbi:MAG: adenosylmethionine--8-amino-7-oxononanoate transaminase [Desulfosarcinaceae bacterium]